MKCVQLLILPILLSMLTGSVYSQELVVTDINTLEEKQIEESRPTLVFLYTDWCRYCAAMKRTTFRNPEVIEALNEHFYYVPFNGESKDEVTLLGGRFEYRSTGLKTGVHQLAEALATIDGKVTYPTVVLLDSEFQIIFQQNSFLNSNEMLNILKSTIKN